MSILKNNINFHVQIRIIPNNMLRKKGKSGLRGLTLSKEVV